jgi:hypothetical protein
VRSTRPRFAVRTVDWRALLDTPVSRCVMA